jgi:hypothetical protein
VTDWAAFAGIAVALLSLLLVLARATQHYVGPTVTAAETAWLARLPDGADHLDATAPAAEAAETEPSMPSGLVLVNVALSQGLFGFVLLVGAWYTEVPLAALGLGPTPLSTGLPAVAWGVGLGVALAGANALGSTVAERLGYAPATELRELLAPETPRGWVLLLGGALPMVAVFEEFLFRATLVGASPSPACWGSCSRRRSSSPGRCSSSSSHTTSSTPSSSSATRPRGTRSRPRERPTGRGRGHRWTR